MDGGGVGEESIRVWVGEVGGGGSFVGEGKNRIGNSGGGGFPGMIGRDTHF